MTGASSTRVREDDFLGFDAAGFAHRHIPRGVLCVGVDALYPVEGLFEALFGERLADEVGRADVVGATDRLLVLEPRHHQHGDTGNAGP